MFAELADLAVSRPQQGMPMSFPLGMAGIVRAAAILDYLHQSERDDYESVNYTPAIAPTNDHDRVARSQLVTRFLARSTSYVMTVCNLDGILKRSYKEFWNSVSELGFLHYLPTDRGEKEFHQRALEISAYRQYRDKVFAHTSFAQPKWRGKTDTKSLQYSSMLFYSGQLLATNSDGGTSHFELTGGGYAIDDHPPNFPRLSILGDRQNLLSHYSAWESMFLIVLRKIPREALKVKN